MIAQALLSILLGAVLIYAWSEYRHSPVIALLSLLTSVAGLLFVWFPSASTRVAQFVGIGRGADLVLYLWVCISLIVLLNIHLKLRTHQEMITTLARTLAMRDAHSVCDSRMVSDDRQTQPAPSDVARRSRQTNDQIASPHQ